MKAIQSTSYLIHFQKNAYRKLNSYITSKKLSKVFILVDENTKKYCLPNFLKQFSQDIIYEVITIKAGEQHKNIDTCTLVWQQLTDLEADRNSLLINLGGGMVTDLGGFVASTFKRGIKFVNIPTTLLSMVDASVGSKTGIDLGTLKNLVGLFSDPEMVLIDTDFLKTMSKRDLNSGLAEVIKYGLTYDKNLWGTLKHTQEYSETQLNAIIYRSIEIKNEIVLQDLKENSLRKVLNFGHTIGHAIESYFLEDKTKESLTHGEAIGIGMIVEFYASSKLFNIPGNEVDILKNKIIELYGYSAINSSDYESILGLMKHDKKNTNGTINFVLLTDIAKFKIDCQVPNELLIEALDYYNS